ICEAVVRDLHWDERLTLTEEQTKQLGQSGDYVCINPYRFEDSCEDRVMLPELFQRLRAQPKLFFVQQLVFGHRPEYPKGTGKSDVESYAELVGAVSDHLAKLGMLDDTLIVVTSDHGIRTRGSDVLPSTYQIPLLFYSPGFEHRENHDLHSQIGFQDL